MNKWIYITSRPQLIKIIKEIQYVLPQYFSKKEFCVIKDIKLELILLEKMNIPENTNFSISLCHIACSLVVYFAELGEIVWIDEFN